jgi:protein-tyrosine phosphatase
MLTIQRILVICEGNHCRSPLAEALFRKTLPDIEVISAGLNAMVGHSAHPEAIRMGKALGLDLEAHRGRSFLLGLAVLSDLILVMDQAQKDACEARVPSVKGRVFLLGHWLPEGEQEIADPIGQDGAVHETVYRHVHRAVHSWLSRLQQEQDS